MSVFFEYAKLYDQLNSEKDYQAEVDFVVSLVGQNKDVIDFGCGTGSHDLLFADRGYRVLGVELNEHMLQEAEGKISASDGSASDLQFELGDIRTFSAGRKFDAALSLFHVFNYLDNIDAVETALQNMSGHLSRGGMALFDTWHGPAVEHLKPDVRIRKSDSEKFEIHRLSEPEFDEANKTVTVNFTFFVEEKETGKLHKFRERHRMRYLFPNELETVIEKSGFRLVRTGEWLTDDKPGEETWSVYYLVEKTDA